MHRVIPLTVVLFVLSPVRWGEAAPAAAEPASVPAWYPEGFPYLPVIDPPGDDAVWPSMECATVITLRYERAGRALYRELRDAAEAAGWSVRSRHDPDYEYRFDARRGNLKVLAMFATEEDGTSRLVLYVLELAQRS